MSVELVTVAGLPEVGLYQHVSVSTGSRLVHVAGQVAVDSAGAPLAVGDLAGQVEACLRNVETAVRAAGGRYEDVAKLTAYVVDWTPDKMTPLVEGLERAWAEMGTSHRPPFTGIGVAVLASPEHLVEIEAVAVLD